MSIRAKVRERISARTIQGVQPSDPRVLEMWGMNGEPSSAGVYVDEQSAQNVGTVYACVTLRAQSLSSLDVVCRKRKPNGDKEIADQHPCHWMFNNSPDEISPAYNIKETAHGHILLRGDSYFELIRNGRGQAVEAHLLDPRRMSVELDNQQKLPIYHYSQPTGPRIQYDRSEVLHILNWSHNGLKGIPPLTLFREQIGFTIAANRYSSEYFRKGGRPLGFLTKPGYIGDKEKESHRDEWRELHGSLDQSHNVGILSGGLDWKNIGMSNQDAQLLGLHQFNKYQIATIFRCPPFLVGDVSQPLASIENVMLQYIIFTVLPDVKRWEGQMNMKLFTEKERFTYSVEFNLDSILRGDAKSRSEAFQIQARNGALLTNEWRRAENRNSVEGGDIPLIMASQIAKLEDVISGKANLDTTGKKSKPADPGGTVNRIAKAYKKMSPEDRQKVKDIVVSMNGDSSSYRSSELRSSISMPPHQS